MKFIGFKKSIYIDFAVENNDKIQNLKLLMMSGYQNIKGFPGYVFLSKEKSNRV